MHKALTHNRGDHVAVAVAAIARGEEVTVVFMDDDSRHPWSRRAEVPYGHKIAVQACPIDASVLENGVRIGVSTTEMSSGTTSTPTTSRRRGGRHEWYGYRRPDGSVGSATT